MTDRQQAELSIERAKLLPVFDDGLINPPVERQCAHVLHDLAPIDELTDGFNLESIHQQMKIG